MSATATAVTNMHDNGHAVLSPSGWSMWSKCTGSMQGLSTARKLATDNLASVEGTTAHMLLEVSLLTWVSPLDVDLGCIYSMHSKFWDDAVKWRDKIVNNINNDDKVKAFANECFEQVISGSFTDEMRHEIHKCYLHLLAFRDDGWSIIPENKVSLESIFGHKHCNGSSDVVMFKANRLIVADLKYGKGIEVSPDDNGQLKLYAGGAMSAVFAATDQTFEHIDLVIMQPRINAGVWKPWSTSYKDLYEFLYEAKAKSENALAAISSGIVTFAPDMATCMWCHRRSDCPARLDAAHKQVTEAFELAGVVEGVAAETHDIDAAIVGEVLDRAPFVLGFFNDMRLVAETRARAGELIPGYKLVKGRSARSWIDDADDTLCMLAKLGLDNEDCTTTKLKSPAQIDKVKKSDYQKVAVKALVSTSYGKESLVPESDKRQAVIKNAQQAFENAGLAESK